MHEYFSRLLSETVWKRSGEFSQEPHQQVDSQVLRGLKFLPAPRTLLPATVPNCLRPKPTPVTVSENHKKLMQYVSSLVAIYSVVHFKVDRSSSKKTMWNLLVNLLRFIVRVLLKRVCCSLTTLQICSCAVHDMTIDTKHFVPCTTSSLQQWISCSCHFHMQWLNMHALC